MIKILFYDKIFSEKDIFFKEVKNLSIRKVYKMKSLYKYEELIVFDTETTGLNFKKDNIIELGVCLYVLENGVYRLKHEMDYLIKINYKVPEFISNLTGITDLMLDKEGHSEEFVAEEFNKYFVSNSSKEKLYIAYNAPFDINFMNQLLIRNNYSDLFDVDFLDLLTVYKDRAKFPHKLKNAITNYKLDDIVENSHRAIDDVKASFEVLRSMSAEDDDIDKYINLFGYNPKYKVEHKVEGVRYLPQHYNSEKKLYK